MSKHTPGPWRVGSSSVGGPTITTTDKRSTIADIRTFGGVHCGGPQHPETDANARLIAAAPELLEALQDLVAEFGVCGLTEKARAAIARATGDE